MSRPLFKDKELTVGAIGKCTHRQCKILMRFKRYGFVGAIMGTGNNWYTLIKSLKEMQRKRDMCLNRKSSKNCIITPIVYFLYFDITLKNYLQ